MIVFHLRIPTPILFSPILMLLYSLLLFLHSQLPSSTIVPFLAFLVGDDMMLFPANTSPPYGLSANRC